MLGAHAGEVHRGFGLLAVPAQVDDDPFAERRVLDVVADLQPEVVGVGPAGAGPLAGRDRRLDDPFAMDVGAPLVGGAAIATAPAVRRRSRPIPSRSAAAGSAGRRCCAR